MATLRPRASRIAPSEAAAMPLPNEDTTPPVTNTNRVIVKSGLSRREECGLRPMNQSMDDGRADYHKIAGSDFTPRIHALRPYGPAYRMPRVGLRQIRRPRCCAPGGARTDAS